MDKRSLARYLSDECSPAEREKIEQWIQSDPINKEMMREFKYIWNASGQNSSELNLFFNPEEDWQQLCHKTRDNEKQDRSSSTPIQRPQNKYPKNVRRNFTQIARVAAIILIASLVGAAAYQILYPQPELAQPVLREISMERGQRGNITLSDGTKVTLNAESKIILPEVFQPDKREIGLQGEAFFEVAHNADRPFIVNTGQAVVQVLGTSLNVRSYPEAQTVEVVVSDGRVSLSSKKEARRNNTILTAGEIGRFIVEENRITSEKVDDLEFFLGWKKGFLKFKNDSMHKVATELERKYDIEVLFDDKKLQDLRLTADLKSRTMQFNLDVISASLGIDYSIDQQQKVTFYQK